MPRRRLLSNQDEINATNIADATGLSAGSSGFAPSRRSFLAGAVGVGLTSAVAYRAAGGAAPATRSTLLEIVRVPDTVTAFERIESPQPLLRSGSRWQRKGIEVATEAGDHQLDIHVSAPATAIRYLHLRWKLAVSTHLLALGDHWERSYGDLGWRNIIPERVMPWYFSTWDGKACHAYGVRTQVAALCFWQLDPDGVSLWLNLSNGGSGVMLGHRTLHAATVVARRGQEGEQPTAALHEFCKLMCAQPSRPAPAIYGTNDWYYAYGENNAAQILKDTDFVAGLSSACKVRPFSVIDMGWSAGPPKFPSMPELASQIRSLNARPGIWIRPLEAPAQTDDRMLMPDLRFGEQRQQTRELAYDPTVPEALDSVLKKVKKVVGWGFELVKHDFSTYDLLGRWGFAMGAEVTAPGWSFHDRSRTNAEIISDLYRSIRESCQPETLILGCNTMGHLGQGIFDIQRTGDDTSGRVWERTRRMGVNTLAFRLPQHKAFFVQDADCVGISPAVPWELNREWMNLLAHSGTALFISPGEGSRDPEVSAAVRQAFELAASGGSDAQPSDWLEQSTPQSWRYSPGKLTHEDTLHFDWYREGGAFPFPV